MLAGISSDLQLENVAIATHGNLRPPNTMPVVLCFNYDAHTKVQVGQPIRCCLIVFYANTLYYAAVLTFDTVMLTCDLLTLDVCRVSAVTGLNCTKFERIRTICGGVIHTSVFDLMTLNMCHMLRYILG